MANKVLVVVTKKTSFKFAGEAQEQDALILQDFTLDGKTELPIRGCIDFTISNQGTTSAFLFGTSIKIPPGTSWSPPKSSGLPYANQPTLTFDGDYQLTRNPIDVASGPSLGSS